jgi:putative ferrous iron transport protein C
VILAEVRDYLSDRGRVPLSDLSARFGVDDEALRAMLEHWIRKGRVRKLDAGTEKCGGCCGCAEQPPEIYEWVQRG